MGAFKIGGTTVISSGRAITGTSIDVSGNSDANAFRINGTEVINSSRVITGTTITAEHITSTDDMTVTDKLYLRNTGTNPSIYATSAANLIIESPSTDATIELNCNKSVAGSYPEDIVTLFGTSNNNADNLGGSHVTVKGVCNHPAFLVNMHQVPDTGLGGQQTFIGGNGGGGFIGTMSDHSLYMIAGNGIEARFHTDGSMDLVGYLSENTSDERLKDNKVAIPNALDKLNTLTGYEFEWNDNAPHPNEVGSLDTGLLAQEVQAVLPQAISPAPFDLDENNESISGEDYLTVQYAKLVPLLLQAIKELSAEVDILKGQ